MKDLTSLDYGISDQALIKGGQLAMVPASESEEIAVGNVG